MTIVSDFAHFSPKIAASGTAVTIGNFDGCHLGHQWLIAETRTHASRLAAESVAVTFEPRPEAFFRGGGDAVLFTPAQKTRAFGELGIRHQIVQTFDEEFSRVTHPRFYEEYLRRCLGAKALVVGDNFRFGHNRGGDTAWLKGRAAADGVAVSVGQAVSHDGERISSTRLRDLWHMRGDVRALREMLGRPHLVEGVIRPGDQLGRTIGTPTANLEEIDQLLPRFGIYAGYVALTEQPTVTRLPEEVVPAVFSVGVRPTLDQASPPVRVEAYLLEGTYGANELYGCRAGYYFTDRIRDEAKLSGIEELKAWIARDVEEAKRLLRQS